MKEKRGEPKEDHESRGGDEPEVGEERWLRKFRWYVSILFWGGRGGGGGFGVGYISV